MPLRQILHNVSSALLQFLSESSAQSSEISLPFPVFKPMLTLLDCLQTEGSVPVVEH